jgi:HEAT repeat protein
MTDALQRKSLAETLQAIELLKEFDPELKLAETGLINLATELDNEALVEYLDQADPDEHGRFAAIAVALGRPALDLAFAVLSKATEARTRAAACTALTYLCADEPQLLAPYFADAHGEVMVQLVFTLGQIGGPDVLDLLRLAAQHPEPRVQKQVVLALGSVPVAIRIPPLLGSLDSQDPQLIAAALQILTREKAPKIAEAILKRISKSDFDSLTEDAQWALFNALTDTADDACVDGLEEILFRGGFLARRCFSRTAAARTLQRIGTERARAVLKRGSRALSPAIRHACNDVRDGA